MANNNAFPVPTTTIAYLCVVVIRKVPSVGDFGIGNLSGAVAIVIVITTHHIPRRL